MEEEEGEWRREIEERRSYEQPREDKVTEQNSQRGKITD